MLSIVDFGAQMQKLLAEPFIFPESNKYIDLAKVTDVTDLSKANLTERGNILPESNPIGEATFLIIQSMIQCHLTQTRIGINELLKAYLRSIEFEDEEKCTEFFTQHIFEIYLYSLKDNYPYTDLLWNYLSNCFHIVSQYLLEESYLKGCILFIQEIATMGKTAAQEGLHTSSIQQLLHTLELRAKELDYPELAAVAKNHRFNLEIF